MRLGGLCSLGRCLLLKAGTALQAGPYEQWAVEPSAEQVEPNERRTAPGARQAELRAASAVPDAGQAGQGAAQADVYESAGADRKR